MTVSTTPATAATEPTWGADLTVYKVDYDPEGKPVVIPVAVQSRGKGRLYITEKRVNGCKDVDYVNYAVRDEDASLVLQSVLFSLTGEAALAAWLEQAQRDILRARSTVAVLERAFAALGRDRDGRLPPAPPEVPAPAAVKSAVKARSDATVRAATAAARARTAASAPAPAPPRKAKPKTRKQA